MIFYSGKNVLHENVCSRNNHDRGCLSLKSMIDKAYSSVVSNQVDSFIILYNKMYKLVQCYKYSGISFCIVGKNNEIYK